MTKVFSTFRGVQKVTGGDFRGLARLIVANKPKEAGELCDQLEAAAAALRAEIESTAKEKDAGDPEVRAADEASSQTQGQENNL